MAKQYEVIGFVGGEPADEIDAYDRFDTQREAMSEVEHLSSMQPENVYVVFKSDGDGRTAKVVVVDDKVFLPM